MEEEEDEIERARRKRSNTVRTKKDLTQEKLNRLMVDINKSWDEGDYNEVVRLDNKVFVVEPTTFKGIYQKWVAERKKQAALRIVGLPVIGERNSSVMRYSSRSSGFFREESVEQVKRASELNTKAAKKERRRTFLRRVSGEW